MNTLEQIKTSIGQVIGWIIGIILLGLTASFMTEVIWEMFVEDYRDVPNFYTFNIIWIAILALYSWNATPEEYSSYKETPWKARLECIKNLCGGVFVTFLCAIFLSNLLSLFINTILDIDILDDRWGNATMRLFVLTWIGTIIGFYLHHKHRDNEELQKQLVLLREGKKVYSPHRKLNEEWEKEKQLTKFMKEREQ